MLNIYKNFGKFDGWTKFNLVWTPLWFVLEALIAITAHQVFAILFMVVFGVLWLLTIWNAKAQLRIKAEREVSEAEYEALMLKIFGPEQPASGRKDDAA